MARATVKGNPYKVRVVQDLTDNWSLEVYPVPDPVAVKTAEPFKNWPVPLCIKIRADSREDALVCGLTHMKQLGQIDDFQLEPNERPVPAAPKAPAPAGDASSEDAPPEDEA